MTMSRFKFRPVHQDYQPGDERSYYVSERGMTIGTVERTWEPSRHVDGEPVEGWSFETFDGIGRGTGLTRVQAIENSRVSA